MAQNYRVKLSIRRQGHGYFTQEEIKSELYDSDEEFCLAVASELLEQMKEDLESLEGDESDD